ncbi:MAG: lipopolysaccharide heptosyltransferase II [Gemmatimonadetes bacterium]|nr:lipopolysaccharide heptosyltransferase II [Gemmatimonadota bacterium]MYG85749.1 lipopolysaccharide heptosyltransferase II [Gemmatimonadota bacterium]MYJ90095.1 lipopolysaccharide heptosyltransferase II [Gemmatimonadota bacterium]
MPDLRPRTLLRPVRHHRGHGREGGRGATGPMCETMTVSETPSRILVIRFSSMGDIVLTSPVTRELGRLFPDAETDFLARAEYVSLARALPGVVAVQRFDPGTGLLSLVTRLRERRYDLALDLHGNLRSRLVAMAGIAGRVLRYDKRRFVRMAIVRRRRRSRPVPHTIDRYLEVLDRLDAAAAPGLEGAHDAAEMRLPQLKVDGAAATMVEERLAGAGIGPDVRLLGVAPGASHGPKRWPPGRFARVADHMAKSRDMKVLLLGSEADRPVTGEVARAMERPAVDWTGTTDLAMLPAAVRRCALLVSNDSGPMHVATAVGTPVIGVFGATHPRLGFAPVGPADTAVTLDLPCSPCSLHGNRACRFRTHACMEELDPGRVIAEAERRVPV